VRTSINVEMFWKLDLVFISTLYTDFFKDIQYETHILTNFSHEEYIARCDNILKNLSHDEHMRCDILMNFSHEECNARCDILMNLSHDELPRCNILMNISYKEPT
jgi:hypothetical protein